MNCYQHPERDATAYCRTCGRARCAADQREIYGVVYCQECIARQLQGAGVLPPPVGNPVTPGSGLPPLGDMPPLPGAPPYPPLLHGVPHPGVALALGLIPGVGAIYNGQYFKAVLQVVVFAVLIQFASGNFLEVMFGIGTAAFYFYMVLDSYRTARALQFGQPVEEVPGFGQVHFNAPLGAMVLIALGTLGMLKSLGIFEWGSSRLFGPAMLIALGVYLLQRQRTRV